jgi:hypothetical protein
MDAVWQWNFGPNVRSDIEEAAVRVRATYDELRSVVKYLRSNYVDVYLLNSMTGEVADQEALARHTADR